MDYTVEHIHAFLVSRLGDNQRDAFDQMLVSQAMLDRIKIVSADRSLDAYEIELIDVTL